MALRAEYRDLAVLEQTGGVAQQQCLALAGAEPGDWLGRGPAGCCRRRGRRDDFRGARQASGLGCGDQVTGGPSIAEHGARRAGQRCQVLGQQIERDRGDHRGGITTVDREAGGVEELQEPDQGLPEPLQVNTIW